MRELKKHYWIPTTTWNLADIFATESISPFSFYGNRLFGSKSNQIVDDQGKQIEAHNSIILYPKNFCNYSVDLETIANLDVSKMPNPRLLQVSNIERIIA